MIPTYKLTPADIQRKNVRRRKTHARWGSKVKFRLSLESQIKMEVVRLKLEGFF